MCYRCGRTAERFGFMCNLCRVADQSKICIVCQMTPVGEDQTICDACKTIDLR